MLRYLLHILKYFFAPSNILASFDCFLLLFFSLVGFFFALKDTIIAKVYMT